MNIFEFFFTPWFWLVLTVFFSLLELACAFNLITIWFAVSSFLMIFISGFTEMLDKPIRFKLHLGIFLVLSILLFIFTRPVAIRKNQITLGDKTGLLRGASLVKGISLKEAFVDSDPQPVITKDNVTLQANTVVYYQVVDPKLYTYGAENPMGAMQLMTVTTLRNVIGELELDQTLTSRDTINAKLRSILDEATDAWGIKVNRVEVKEIEPPKTVLEAMEAQMKAEREKRAKILEAEGLKESSILKAEGEKQSAILQAEANKETAIREAEGKAEAILTV